MLERYLVDQCSPTLAGIKTGSLFSIQGEDPALIKREVQKINRIFYGKGLLLLPLKTTGGYSLLKEFGYTSSLPSRCLVHLIQRVRKEGAFPHEIGLFLGYPPEDVKGFIENPHCKSRCRSCVGGCWKVYHEPEKAQALFRKYEQCTKNYRKRLTQGASIEQLAVAA